jgi:hypothetical protein
VYYYDLIVGSRAGHARPPTLDEIVRTWEDYYTASEASLSHEGGSVVYRIGDLQVDRQEQVVRLLIRKSDINAPDAAFSKLDTGEVRFARKGNDEGGDIAAHLLISLSPEQHTPHTHLCMLEGMAGISHRHVQPLLNTLIRHACHQDKYRFSYPDPAGARHRDGSEKRHPFQPKLELRGHTSDDLARDIERGQVNNLELVEAGAQGQFGGDQYLAEDSYSLSVKVDKNIPRQNRLDRILNAMRSRSATYGTGRIKFKDENDKTHTVSYNLQTGTPEQQMYVKSFVVRNINPPMALSSENIVSHFTDEIERRLKSERRI